MVNVYPNIDLFASRINHKVKPYVAFRPDPCAFAVNAFSLSWHEYKFYAFPPFCIILKTLQKIAQDRATGLMVVPFWPTQPWWPYFTNMLIDHPVYVYLGQNTHYGCQQNLKGYTHCTNS